MIYTMTCTCGDVMSVDAASRDEAVSKLKAQTTKETVGLHMALKHPGAKVPTLVQAIRNIERCLKES